MLSALVAAALSLVPATRTPVVVRPGSAVPTLAAALRLAGDGDTILIEPGTYREGRLEVTRSLTIIGRGNPVLDGGGGPVLTIRADSVTVRGLTIRHVVPSSVGDPAGIRVEGARGCRIEDNTLLDTFFGIYLAKVNGCVVRHNRIRGSGRLESLNGNAVHAWSSEALLIEDNDLTGHRDGVYFEFVTGAEVVGNRSTGQMRYGLHFMFSHGCRYRGNLFARNRAGVAVMYTRDVVMEANRFEDTWGSGAYGLLLKDIRDSRLSGNRFQNNSTALFAEGTIRVTIEGNEFLGNGWGAQVMADADETVLRHNRFERNAFDLASNSRNAASTVTENYWDRYHGYDLDRDGIGDVPYAPVRLFALIVQQNRPALILLRSLFVSLLETAEKIAPVLTPKGLVDRRPLMRWPAGAS